MSHTPGPAIWRWRLGSERPCRIVATRHARGIDQCQIEIMGGRGLERLWVAAHFVHAHALLARLEGGQK